MMPATQQTEQEQAPEARKPDAPEGVPKGALDSIVEATERRMTDQAVLHVYSNMEAYQRVAEGIARSGMTHHKKTAEVVTIAIAAFEMNLGLMTALRGMYLVDGKLAMETWLMDLLASRLGVTKTIHESTIFRASLTLHHPDRPDVDAAFGLEDAKRAQIIQDFDPETGVVTPQRGRSGKVRGVWHKHPEEMCYWRALSKGLRRIAPDLFGGVYTTDEAEQFDPRITHVPDATDTNAELDALANGVDPDPAEYTEDEIETYANEVREARKRSLVTSEDADYALALVDEGRWTDMREQQDAIRGLLANAKADEARGKGIVEDVEKETAGLFDGEGT